MGKTNEVAMDSKGNYKRDLGREANGKQHRFYLGRDAAQAEKRAMKLERLWELVKARWESQRMHFARLEEKWRQEVERGEWADDPDTLEEIRAVWLQVIAAPCWDSVTLKIADAIRHGEAFWALSRSGRFERSGG